MISKPTVINKPSPRMENVSQPVKSYQMNRKRFVKSLILENFTTVISKPAVNNKLAVKP